MTPIRAQPTAMALAALGCAVSLAAVGLVMALMWSPGELLGDVAYQTFTVVGALLFLRRPRNPIGPLFVAAGVGSALASGTGAVLRQAREGTIHISSPLIHLIGSVQAVTWLPTFAVPLIFVTLLFPDGSYLSARWARVGRVAGGAIAVAGITLVTLTAILPTRQVLAPEPTVDGGVQQVLSTVSLAGMFVGLACGVCALAAMWLRYRGGDERTKEQVRLVVFAAVLAMVATLLDGKFGLPANVIMPLGVPLIAIAVAVAVVRYRLYDIDRLVSRTVSYVVITTVLVGLYVASIALTTRALPFSSSLSVAASTLIAAAAVHPLRRHVQRAVDRRFNRSRYDAEGVVDAFAQNTRLTVDASTIQAQLIAAVQRTVQPATVSLWVGPPR